ncbi:MAG: sugar nucleotide-binding protein [Burkholderiales bacterium]
MSGNRYLVVGGDSLVGGGLYRALENRGHAPLISTRRPDTVGERRVFLDFENEASFRVPAEVGYAFIVAAATNYDRCEKDPLAYRINVELIPNLVRSLLEQGVFVTFISTNSVFGGDQEWPDEDAQHAPGIAYAKQKAEAEKRILALVERLQAHDKLNIVRLTKILNKDTSPIPGWLSSWRRNESVQPFSDLIFAPMSVGFVGESLAVIGERRISGNLHLSGERNVSYVDFAKSLSAQLGFASSLIEATTSVEKGVHIPFKPRFSGLGMRKTSRLTGLQPQSLESVTGDLAREIRAINP